MLQIAGIRGQFSKKFVGVGAPTPPPKCKGMTIPYLVKFHENYQNRMTDCRKYGSAFVEIPGGNHSPPPPPVEGDLK